MFSVGCLVSSERKATVRSSREFGVNSGAKERTFRPVLLCAALSLLLSGCALGPVVDVGPEVVRPEMAVTVEEGGKTAPASWQLEDRWWTVFGDEVLTQLVEKALTASPKVSREEALLRAYEARLAGADAERLPSVTATVSAGELHMTEAENRVHHYGQRDFESYAAKATFSWEADLWGGLAHREGAARADYLAQDATRAAVRLSLAAEVADTYFRVRTLEMQIRITRAMLASYEHTCRVYAVRVSAGHEHETTLRRFEAERARTKASMLELEADLVKAKGLLAELTGATPVETAALMAGDLPESLRLDTLAPPPAQPEALPTDLLLRRPDVERAGAALEAALHRVGVARAARLPNLTLTADAGFESTEWTTWIDPASSVRSLFAGLTGPIWDAGRRKAKEAEAVALVEAARADYVAAATRAARETLDAMNENRASREIFLAHWEEVRRLMRTNEIIEKQYDAGLMSVMDVLPTALRGAREFGSETPGARVRDVALPGARRWLAGEVRLPLREG